MPDNPISEKKIQELSERLKTLGVVESDLEENFVKGSGSGGQKLNKSSSCVVLKHIHSNVVVKCQKTRSLSSNRFFARRLLCEKLEELQLGKTSKKAIKTEKLKKQKKRRKRRAIKKIEDKP